MTFVYNYYLAYFSKSLSLNIKDDQKSIGLYLSLYGGSGSPNSIIGRLENIEAQNLKLYAERTAIYWYNSLKEKLSKLVLNCFDYILHPREIFTFFTHLF